MEVREYVRTDDGLIGKIVSEPYEYKDSIVHDIDFGDNNIYNEYEMYQNIIKTSPSIIDILEIGDYVNGLKVIQMYSPEGKYTLWIKLSDNTFIDNSEDIKSITTKEQFKNIEYEVK